MNFCNMHCHKEIAVIKFLYCHVGLSSKGFCHKSHMSPSFGQFYSSRNLFTTFVAKALVLVNSTAIEIFNHICCKSPTFGQSYRTRNILTRFYSKSPTFGQSLLLVNLTELEIF